MSVFVMRERIEAIDSRLDKILDDEKLREHVKNVIRAETEFCVADVAIVAKNEIDNIAASSIARIHEHQNDLLDQREELYLKLKEEVRDHTNSSIEENIRPIIQNISHHDDEIKLITNRLSVLPVLFGMWTAVTILFSVLLSYWII